MGELARTVQEHLRDRLAERPGEWQLEGRVGGTPVDVVGRGEGLTLVELEWRRADPADDAAKLFRGLAGRADDGPDDGRGHGRTDHDDRPVPVRVAQLFSGYYDLAGGGHSSKRLNAEFVGRAAADRLARVEYRAVDLAIDPPKRGGELPDGWRAAVDEAAERV